MPRIPISTAANTPRSTGCPRASPEPSLRVSPHLRDLGYLTQSSTSRGFAACRASTQPRHGKTFHGSSEVSAYFK